MLSAIKRQMISHGAIQVGELHFAAPVPDEGDNPTELEETGCIDGTWIDPKLLHDGRTEEMEYMRKHGVFEVFRRARMLRQRLQSSHAEVGGQGERGRVPFEIGLSGNQEPR